MNARVSLFVALTLAGCREVAPTRDGGVDAGAPLTWSLQLLPSDLTLRVVDGVPATRTFVAFLVPSDGSGSQDVTARTTFTLEDPGFGTFSGSTLTTRQQAGHTHVQASVTEASTQTGLVVRTTQTRLVGAPPNAAALFAAAADDPLDAPEVLYPEDGVTLPAGFGAFDVHWADDVGNDLFEVTLSSTFTDVRLYVKGAPNAAFTAAEWGPIAAAKEPLALQVAGLQTRAPLIKGSSISTRIAVTNEPARGALYASFTGTPTGVWRSDVGALDAGTGPFVTDASPGGSCVGCHAVSRDGTKLAVASTTGDSAIYRVADRSVVVPVASRWTFASFNGDGTKLVGVLQGVLRLFDASSGAVLTTVPLASGTGATHPEFSPDGSQLAYVETTAGNADTTPVTGSIVVRSFDAATNSFGAARTVVAGDASGQNYYPSWSPDGQWLAFTRTDGAAYNNATARTWVVKADGSGAPIELAEANGPTGQSNSIARWLPFGHTQGASNTPVFFVSFGSNRIFGNRLAAGGVTQLWLTPFFPARAAAGLDPSGPATHVPFQDLGANTYDGQWSR